MFSGFGVSPTPVKDALNRLAVEGLVDIRPRNGTFVAEFEPQDVAETFEIRRGLECLAAERMVERATPELVARFRRLVEALDKAVDDEPSRVEHERRNNELHLAIVEGSGNRRLLELYRNLNAHLTIALEVLALTEVDEVWIMLAGQHPFRLPCHRPR